MAHTDSGEILLPGFTQVNAVQGGQGNRCRLVFSGPPSSQCNDGCQKNPLYINHFHFRHRRDRNESEVPNHFPMQKVEKMRFRISSAVVAPVMASMGRRAA